MINRMIPVGLVTYMSPLVVIHMPYGNGNGKEVAGPESVLVAYTPVPAYVVMMLVVLTFRTF